MKSLVFALSALCLTVPVYAEEAAANGFETSLALGMTLTDGNTETSLATLRLTSERIAPPNELRLGIEGAYGETDSETSAENARAVAVYRRLINDRLYGALDLSVHYDAQAGVDYRVIASPGLGYFWVKNDRVRLSSDIGPAYIAEKVDGVRDDYFALRIAERLEVQLSETARIWQALEYVPTLDDFDAFLLNVEAGVEAALNSWLNLQVVLQNAHNSEPGDGREKNDLTFITALAVKL